MNIFLAPVLFAGVFAAYVMDDSDIDNGNVEMYSQVTNTGKVVFNGKTNGIVYPLSLPLNQRHWNLCRSVQVSRSLSNFREPNNFKYPLY